MIKVKSILFGLGSSLSMYSVAEAFARLVKLTFVNELEWRISEGKGVIDASAANQMKTNIKQQIMHELKIRRMLRSEDVPPAENLLLSLPSSCWSSDAVQ